MRTSNLTEDHIFDLIKVPAHTAGFEIVRIRLSGNRHLRLQIMAERPDGQMSVDDCASLSHILADVFEEHEPVAHDYTMEISSPGIDRPLTRAGDFAKWVGYQVKLELAQAVDGRKKFSAHIEGEVIKDNRGGSIIDLILEDGRSVQIDFTDLSNAQLILTDGLIKAAYKKDKATWPIDKISGLSGAELEKEVTK